MRDEIRWLINTLCKEAITKDGLAQELADLADQDSQNGNHRRAEGMRNLSRHHRVISMQTRAQIAALVVEYAHLFR